MKLYEIAHGRSGDKGNILNISVIAYDMEDFVTICKKVTVEAVMKYLPIISEGVVIRYELPQLGALNFVFPRGLAGGVTKSLRLDKHGKCLSSQLLDMDI